MKKQLIIHCEYGGLGDHLFFSPIPRLAKIAGYDKVYLSSSSNFRSLEVFDLVWNSNPYFDGVIDAANAEIRSIAYDETCDNNILEQFANCFNLPFSRPLLPELYYSPIKDSLILNKIVVDLNYVSFVGAVSKYKILKYLKTFDPESILLVNCKSNFFKAHFETIDTQSIYHYLQLIISAKQFVCMTSGGATLACCYHVNAVCFYGYGQNKIFHHCPSHKYVDVSQSSPFKFISYLYLKFRNKIRYFNK